ncbi:MAG TPA: VWA domain-containing protein [Pyrinomonadaceae bacterium]|nr:VWA domain-containing protein [Pyrinomonadaceae bacterium]
MRHSNKYQVAGWLLLFCFAANLRGQEPRPSPTPPPVPKLEQPKEQEPEVVRISTNLVQVDVVVTKDGKQITDLTPADFEILEDGRVQQITSFGYVSASPSLVNSNTATNSPTPSTATDAPPPVIPKPPLPREINRTVAIVVDDLGMSFQSMVGLRHYLRTFLAQNLRPNDLIAIIRTGGELGALQQFTSDPRVLSSAIADLKWNPCSRVGVSVLPPERSLVIPNAPETQMQGRVPPDRSPSSSQINRPTVGNESNPCSVGGSLAYSINALRFILSGMRDLPGRKSMMVISDNLPLQAAEQAPSDFGFQRPVRENANLIDVWTQSKSYADGLHSLAELAIRGSVVIYTVIASGLQTIGPHAADEISFPPLMSRRRPDQQDQLTKLTSTRSTELSRNRDGAEVIAKETGGFVVRNSNDFGLDKIFEDQSGYYLIGYRPADSTFDRRFHTIQARVKRGGLTVRTRAGFYGVSTEETRAGTTGGRDRLNTALVTPFASNDIPIRLTPFFANDPVRGSMLRLFMTIDAKELTFKLEPDGTHTANFELISVLFGENGSMVNRQDKSAALRLRGVPYERVLREGVVYGFDWPVNKTGALQMRVAVRDTASQRVGASGQFVYVPNIKEGDFAISGIILNAETGENPEANNAFVSRRFHQGSSLAFGYVIYNATTHKTKGEPQLTTKTLVFRNAEKIYSSDPVPVTFSGQSDLQRISTGARLQLGPALTPGEYALQIIVEDKISKRTTTQWTQFEVIK